VLLAFRIQPAYGGIIFVLISLFTAPLAVTVAWWFTAVLLVAVVGLAGLWHAPVPRWARLSGFTALLVVWIGCGFIWLGMQY